MDVLFISSKGSQYRYYKTLAKNTLFKARVVTLFPGFGFKIFNTGLNKKVINEGLDFHLERKKRKYSNQFPNAFVMKVYTAFSALYFSLIYLKFRRYLTSHRPKNICIWNGHRLPEMAVKAAARGLDIKIFYFENGLIPNTTVMDSSGVNAFSSLPKDPNFYLEYAKQSTDKVDCLENKSLVARKPHKSRKKLRFSEADLNKRYVFVPFQVNFDSQVIVNSPVVNSMHKLYEFVELLLQETPSDLLFYIKEHPSDSHTYSELHKKHDRIQFVDENTEELIRNADAVLTLNSSVGIEASMLGKPVIVLGNACYAIQKLVYVSTSFRQVAEILNNLEQPDQKVRQAFFSYLENKYLLPGAWQNYQRNIDSKHLECFENKIKGDF
ncbi:hypothetical protein HF888_06510 [Bermanella marisrubri]|uniref:capsular polysaccharide export protein, LipB/KpsS family n=1 Tax=Bermanella marisrubri TaxID=207949 RepID=UPI001442B895|nr:CDP-glycerol glycerophosphotransferase family protein [Bermanella marisrubri]QIZ83901.1 hypothetical protein HF888_06510 [Bermanella marisrubri]